jgi:predicted kinase
MFRRADELASKSRGGIILDATFVSEELRMRAAEIAAKHQMAFVIMETSCTQEIALGRIKNRTKEKYESNALTEEAYLANKNKFQPIEIDAVKKRFPNLKVSHVIIDTCICGMANWTVIKSEKR